MSSQSARKKSRPATEGEKIKKLQTLIVDRIS